jgi:cyclic beta-1,2-glucan synthetase
LSGSRLEHVGYYLVGRGRDDLEGVLGFRPGLSERASRWAFNHATFVYLGAIASITALAMASTLAYARFFEIGIVQTAAVAVLVLLPALMVSVNLVNLLVTRLVPPRVLPKLDFSDGIPRRCRTMVVVPALLSSPGDVDFLLRQLELHYLANPDPELGYALLSDFPDAPKKHVPEDKDLLEHAKRGIKQLNREYGGEKALEDRPDGPFYFFHRERLWNPGENRWMGWERKRGKLVEFNRLLRADGETSYTVKLGALDFLSGVKYVITLDADTALPMGSAAKLVGTLAHPLNQAEFEPARTDRDPDSSPADERVIAGYTILQPRTEVKPTRVTQTPFTRVFGGDAGLDLYTRAVSDVYQDLFGEGIYTGKGIYDVEALERSLRGRVPENALLSHDLFEGMHGRAGLVSDVVLFEDYPPTYLSYAHRKHRWVRGDWQILPWMFSRVPNAGDGRVRNTLSVLDRWKILDNLRRSLRSPALMALLVAGWLVLPGSPAVWTLLTAVASGVPLVTGAVTALSRRLQGAIEVGGPELEAELKRWLLSVAFLPYETILMVDAIGTTLVRLTISRKRLLQWTTAAHTVRLFGRRSRIGLLWRKMSGGPVLSLIVAVALGLLGPQTLILAAPLLTAWLLSPQVAAWISQPLKDDTEQLSSRHRRRLRRLARRTWLFFERFVGPEDHWLPPDHFQEEPRGTVSHRTSPTNIGLMLLSTLAASDLGYITLTELMLRVGDAFDSIDQLERYRGHVLNWYDTRDLRSLTPRYVSTVDSGNLAACLMALGQGLRELEDQPIMRWERWRGLCDALGVLREIVENVEQRREVAAEARALREHAQRLCDQIARARDEPDRWVPLLDALGEDLGETFARRLQDLLEAGAGTLDTATLRDLRLWSERIHVHLRDLSEEMNRLLPWMRALDEQPMVLSGDGEQGIDEACVARVSKHESWQALQDTLPEVPRLGEMTEMCQRARSHLADLGEFLEKEMESVDESAEPRLADQLQEARRWCRDLDASLETARMAAGSMMIGLSDLVERTEQYVQDMDFAFLYDHDQDVFHIGYRVDAEELDDHHYDLLASEARIASIVAMSKGDAPQRHWLHLDRPLAGVDGMRTLLSWGGSMFEYLMPDLVMRRYDETLLQQATLAAVRRQIDYAHQKGVPWGISESGYYRLDAQMNYQYKGFGVPGLGRKRGLGEDLVIAPYASLLAVDILPESVLENVDRLIDQGMLGHYGFYEAVDYTESRLPMGQTRAIVRSYMAHHQGMILTGLSNYLNSPRIVDRFHRDPRVQSVEFLLQEQVPRHAPLEETPEESIGVETPKRERVKLEPWSVPTQAPMPQLHCLSNGRYSLFITDAGAGYSAYVPSRATEGDPTALTRWRADTTLDCWGTWIYVQDRSTNTVWSVCEQPTGAPADEEQVRFYPHEVEFRRRYGDVSIHTEIAVAPKDDAEIRRVRLTNHSDGVKHLRVTSYGEVVLASQDQDRRHPAFNKMFVKSEYVGDLNALLVTRRRRSDDEEPLYLAHMLVPPSDLPPTGEYESDRGRFIGRGRTTRTPAALLAANEGTDATGGEEGGWLSGTAGATLDPIMALGQAVRVDPHTTAQVTYLTLVGDTRDDVIALARLYRARARIDRAFEEAHAQSQVELRNRDLQVSDVQHIQQLLSVLLYPHSSLRAPPATLAQNKRGQSALWPLGISGDYPILLVRISDEERIPLLRELLRAHAYWRQRHIKVDMVILNERDVGYAQELSEQIHHVIRKMDSDDWLSRRGGIFVLRAGQMDQATKVLLETAARATFDADGRPLDQQLGGMLEPPSRLPAFTPSGLEGKAEATPPLPRPDNLQFDNGFGGFSPDGREYVVYLESGSQGEDISDWTPAPWINVIANESFGFLVSDTGMGCSWAANSGENRLTPWRNDPVSDTPSEALYLRDEETGEIWSSTPLPAGAASPYLVRHGAGYSVFEHHSHGLRQRLRVLATRDDPVKVIQLRLENTWGRTRRLTATFFAEWVLGINRDHAQQYVVSEYDSEATALLARNAYSPEFSQRGGSDPAVAFLASSKAPHGLTADRAEFLGRKGGMHRPAALDRVGLASRVEPGLDPCAALQLHVDLAPGETKEVFFLLGQGEHRGEALELIERYGENEAVEEAWDHARNAWNEILDTVRVDTPDTAMDLLLNRWLLYQAVSCRVWGRSALYQSSGAFGFRDQLQDVMSLLHAAPELARRHILRSARHQFEEGDVLHWWHPPSGRGVRTRISDDLLWLPYVTAEYVRVTGDDAILTEDIPFRQADPLEADEEERYGQFDVTDETATLYDHCLRALDRGSTFSRRGLPLMGAGDWNDGLNRVGHEGQGESVWLGWFLYTALSRFAHVCERMDDADRAEGLRTRAGKLQKALEQHAWDGQWYIRATYDDGTPLGSARNSECKISSMPQSWAVLSRGGDGERARQAMAAVADRLVQRSEDGSAGLVLLFTPPFDETRRDPGYIKGYPPGIRENGGQYTHAALWAVWAYTELGQGDRAGELFRLLNPIHHSETPQEARRYRVEPYVVAADVYSADDHFGRGGWTWYTGSSGWMYRLGIEAILGLRKDGKTLRIDPCIPRDWSEYRMTYRYRKTVYEIKVQNPEGVSRGVESVILDGSDVTEGGIRLEDDGGRHEVRVTLG